eukprot:3793039-Amphidinium_carterae.2
MATSTIASTSLMPTANSVKRDARHLHTPNDMDYDFSNKNRQVMSPTPEGNQLGGATQRSLTPRTRTQQNSTKGAATAAAASRTAAEDELPYWAKSPPGVPPTNPATPVGGILTQQTMSAPVLTKPKAVPHAAKARLPMPKRPLATQREDDELPSWAQDPATQPASAGAASTPVLVTKPSGMTTLAPTKWTDMPNPQLWERFVSHGTATYSLYRPAPHERLVRCQMKQTAYRLSDRHPQRHLAAAPPATANPDEDMNL